MSVTFEGGDAYIKIDYGNYSMSAKGYIISLADYQKAKDMEARNIVLCHQTNLSKWTISLKKFEDKKSTLPYGTELVAAMNWYKETKPSGPEGKNNENS